MANTTHITMLATVVKSTVATTPPQSSTSTSELDVAVEANNNYEPMKMVLAVLGCIALAMFLSMVGWYFWSKRQQEQAAMRKLKEEALDEIFGKPGQERGSTSDGFVDVDLESANTVKQPKRNTRWSFAGYFN